MFLPGINVGVFLMNTLNKDLKVGLGLEPFTGDVSTKSASVEAVQLRGSVLN